MAMVIAGGCRKGCIGFGSTFEPPEFSGLAGLGPGARDVEVVVDIARKVIPQDGSASPEPLFAATTIQALHFHPTARAAHPAAVLQIVRLKGASRVARASAVNAARCDPSRDRALAFPASCVVH